MKNLRIRPGLLPSIIKLPSSKSYGNRALILGAIKPDAVTIYGLPEATDVTFLVSALKQIGLKIEQTADHIQIKNYFPACETNGTTIEVGEGGTTARFLAALLCLGSKPYVLKLGQRLKDRPWDEFVSLVNGLGGKAELNVDKLFIQGPLTLPSNLEIGCQRTTQVASGFQLAYAFTDKIITPVNLTSSMSYWKMTEEMVSQFKNTSEFHVPLDWSSASYPLAFGALKQTIAFPGLFYDPFQADAKFYYLLKDLGAITDSKDGISVHPVQVTKDIQLYVSDCLDLVPALSFLLSHISGEHKLRGFENLVHKESDRLKEIQALLAIFGRKTKSDDKVLTIWGSQEPVPPQDLQLPDDHRMVMTGALFQRYHAGGSLSPVEAVNKSYPDFFQLINN